MILTIECECGNKISMKALPKKYLQLRDHLESKQFYFDGAKITDGKLKEIRITCDKCWNWIDLGTD